MVLNLPLSKLQTKVLEDILARVEMTRYEEQMMTPVLKRVRENLEYHAAHPAITSLDRYYERGL